MYLQRQLKLPALLAQKSFFLLGPRATGKTALIRHQLSETALVINLLRSDVFLRLNHQPWELENLIAAKKPEQHTVVIDEI